MVAEPPGNESTPAGSFRRVGQRREAPHPVYYLDVLTLHTGRRLAACAFFPRTATWRDRLSAAGWQREPTSFTPAPIPCCAFAAAAPPGLTVTGHPVVAAA